MGLLKNISTTLIHDLSSAAQRREQLAVRQGVSTATTTSKTASAMNSSTQMQKPQSKQTATPNAQSAIVAELSGAAQRQEQLAVQHANASQAARTLDEKTEILLEKKAVREAQAAAGHNEVTAEEIATILYPAWQAAMNRVTTTTTNSPRDPFALDEKTEAQLEKNAVRQAQRAAGRADVTAKEIAAALYPAWQAAVNRKATAENKGEIPIVGLSAIKGYPGAADELYDLIRRAENDQMYFPDQQKKNSYLSFLYEKRDEYDQGLYRDLEKSITQANLLSFPEERALFLLNSFSNIQLQILANFINEYGVKRTLDGGKLEPLMRAVLDSKVPKAEIRADNKSSFLAPRVFQGLDVLEDNNMFISGYYYENGGYFIDIINTQDASQGKSVCVGGTLPREVKVGVTCPSNWDMVGAHFGQYLKILLSPQVMADMIYKSVANAGVTDYLPTELAPSDIPIVGDFLEKIDPFDHNIRIKKETIFVNIWINRSMGNDNMYKQERFNEAH